MDEKDLPRNQRHILLTGDARKRELVKLNQQNAMENLAKDFKKTFETDHGIRVFNYITNQLCKVETSPKGGFDSGIHSVGLKLQRALKEADLETFLKTVREACNNG